MQNLAFIHLSPSISVGGWVRIPAIIYSSDAPPEAVLDIPECHDTKQVLEFCGLDRYEAIKVHKEFEFALDRVIEQEKESDDELDWPFRSLDDPDILEIALDRMKRAKETDAYRNAWGQSKWVHALKALGIDKQMVQAIMSPPFRRVRETGTPYDWARDSISNNHEFLARLPELISARMGTLKHLMKMYDRAYQPSCTPNLELLLGRDSALREIHKEKGTIITYLPMDSYFRVKYINEFHPKTGRCNVLPGNVTLFDTNQDFGKDHIRFFMDSEAAVLIAGYKAIRMRSREAGLLYNFMEGGALTEEIPEDEEEAERRRIASIQGKDWEEYVCRTRATETGTHNAEPNLKYRPERLYPPWFREYYTSDILVGPVCGYTDDKISELESVHDVYPLRLSNGNFATQIVYLSEEARMEWVRQSTKTTGITYLFATDSPLDMTFFDKEDLSSKNAWDIEDTKGWNGYRWTRITFRVKGFEGYEEVQPKETKDEEWGWGLHSSVTRPLKGRAPTIERRTKGETAKQASSSDAEAFPDTGSFIKLN